MAVKSRETSAADVTRQLWEADKGLGVHDRMLDDLVVI
jgi:hypothetical protein